MEDVRLTISGIVIDIADVEKLRLAITKSIAQIQDTSQGDAGFTLTMVVPGTKNNDKALGFGQDINSVKAISQNVRPEAEIEVGGTVLLDGFVRSSKQKINNRSKTHEYHITLFGDNGDWKHKMNGLNVNELDYSEFDHVYNRASMDASELTNSSGIALTKPDVVYPLINYGSTLDMPHPVLTNQDIHTVQVKNRFPALQKRSILKRMYEGIGFKITGNFIDSDFFSRQYLPFTNPALLNPESFRTERLFRAGLASDIADAAAVIFLIPFDDDTTDVRFDNGANFDPAVFGPSNPRGTYTIDQDSRQNFILETLVEETGTPIDPLTGASIIIDGGNFIRVTDPDGNEVDYRSGITPFPAGVPTKIHTETGFQDFKAGTTVTAHGLFVTFVGSGSVLEVKKEGTFLYNRIQLGSVLKGQTVNMNINLPDVLQLDFFRAIRDEFNLMTLTDVGKREVFIEPHDDFYTTKAIDWTDKLDKNKDEIIEDLNDSIAKTIKYSFKSDSNDKVVEQIEIQSNNELASLDVTNSNKFVEGEQTIGNTFFAPTLMDFWPYVGLFSVKVPRLNKDTVEFPGVSAQSTDFVFRSLYYNGIQPLPSGESWFFDGGERFNFPNFYSVDEINDNDNSLYWNNTRRSKGPFEKFHRNRFEIIDQGKL